ncbi:hypothetical protein [Streptomyces sp. IBSBF 2435]|uniref:hypothetical protein n=1 Tax=Streptomyces sp. IBSBF 2435 TaxID=2903531 RepID=UPI002FDC7200
MKKIALALLGLFLAGMAITATFTGGIFGIAFGIAFAAGSWRAFRAVGRLAPAAPTEDRPWRR